MNGGAGQNSTNPKVSICVTFFNAERYIHRLIESCINQTYKNIELVLVDDESTDRSREIIQKYAAQDSRISYYLNEKRVGLAESELKMFRVARGDYSIMVGADDWIARNYVENGVRTFLAHPEAAGIIPQVLWFSELENGTFNLFDSRFDTFTPPRSFSA